MGPNAHSSMSPTSVKSPWPPQWQLLVSVFLEEGKEVRFKGCPSEWEDRVGVGTPLDDSTGRAGPTPEIAWFRSQVLSLTLALEFQFGLSP